MNIQPLNDHQSELGEGPIWSKERQALYYVDINGCYIHKYDLPTKELSSYKTPSKIGFLTIGEGSEWVVGLEKNLAIWKVDTEVFKEISPEVEEHLNTRINDGKMDPFGQIWFGTLDYDFKNPIASLYRYDGKIHKVIEGITISNGLCWSGDGQYMYYIDTPTREIAVYNYNWQQPDELKLLRKIQVNPEDGMPDGMTIDQDGYLWVAMWGGAKVVAYDSATGTRMMAVDLPTPYVTCPAIGGLNGQTLFITTAKNDLIDDVAGKVFSIELPAIKGVMK